MKILQISPMVPLPADVGGRIGILGILKSISTDNNEVIFLSYKNKFAYSDSEKILSKYCRPIFIQHNTDNKIISIFFNLFSSTPYNISKYKTRKMGKKLIEILTNEKPDAVHIDSLHMAWVTEIIKKKYIDVPVILREHNIESNIMKRFSVKQKNPLIRFYSWIQYKKLVKYEAKYCELVDCCAMISLEDEQDIKKLNKNVKTCVIPAGIDEDLIAIGINNNKIENSICHIGPMDWYPNYDSLQWFMKSIFPEILMEKPEIRLFIFGKGTDKIEIPDQIKNNVVVKGFVKDLWEDVSKMQLVIVPLRIGGGIRIKIIETMAAGINILSTSIGKEGIPVFDQKHLLIADSERDFSNKIIKYFNSEFENENMINESIQLIKNEFTWKSVGKKFNKQYLQSKRQRMEN